MIPDHENTGTHELYTIERKHSLLICRGGLSAHIYIMQVDTPGRLKWNLPGDAFASLMCAAKFDVCQVSAVCGVRAVASTSQD